MDNRLKKLGLYLGITVLNIAALYTFFRNHNDNPVPVDYNLQSAEEIIDVPQKKFVDEEQPPLESAVKETTPLGNSAGEPPLEELTEEEQRYAKWLDYIEEVKKEMPEKFEGAELFNYGKIYAIIYNDIFSNDNYQKEVERISNSLKKLGVEEGNLTIIYKSKDLENTITEIYREHKPDDLLICCVAGKDSDNLYSYLSILLKEVKKIILFENYKGIHHAKHFSGEDNAIAVSAATIRSPVVTENYSFTSSVIEALNRGASPEQALKYAREEQKKIVLEGFNLGFVTRDFFEREEPFIEAKGFKEVDISGGRCSTQLVGEPSELWKKRLK